MVLLMNFLGGQSSDENGGSVPHNLENLSGGEFGDIDLHIGIPVVPGPTIKSANESDGVKSGEVDEPCIDCSIEHIDLSPSNVGLMLVVDSVLVEPVINSGDEIDVVSKVRWS